MSIRASFADARVSVALVCFGFWSLCCLGLGSLGGCARSRSGSTPSGPPAVVVVPAAPSIAVGVLRGPPETCVRKLAVYALDKAEGCVVDEQVTAEPGQLEYPCRGGTAEAHFRDTVFRGELENGELDLRREREFSYEDGCRWRSVERIAGSLSAGRLRYSYDDAPVSEQRGCAEPCGASALVSVIGPE